jgi:hypothetical protein
VNAAAVTAMLLAIAVVAGSLRAWRLPRRRVHLALQALAAIALYACLFPPATRESFRAGELLVLAPGITPAQRASLDRAAARVALPGVPADAASERVPDLGTALRRRPDLRRLHVVGGGLPARDRDAARGLAVRFDAAPLPPGLVELHRPATLLAGHAWQPAGRVEGLPGARIELRDPAGVVAATSVVDTEGRFTLPAQARGAGTADFALRVLAADGSLAEEVPLPIAVVSGRPLRLLVLAGAPDPDLKYLRRWARDAGAVLDSRIVLSDGIAQVQGAPAVDAAALGRVDVVILDERSWAALDDAARATLRRAVRNGLGLLLRVTGPVPPVVAADWRKLGFALAPAAAADPPPLRLDRAIGLHRSGLSFTARPLEVRAEDAAPLLHADAGTAAALWRAEGRGRVGLWWLADSWRLVLAGEKARHATLWAQAVSTLARPGGKALPLLPVEARVDQRALLCGLGGVSVMEDPAGRQVPLVIEGGRDAMPGCAAWWPAQPGWHVLVTADGRWPVPVRAVGEAPGLLRADDQAGTAALSGGSGDGAIASRPRPLPRWPFFLAWLAAAAALWWLERSARRDRASA